VFDFFFFYLKNLSKLLFKIDYLDKQKNLFEKNYDKKH